MRQFVQAFKRRDLAAMTRSLDPEVKWTPGGPADVERAVYRGRDEVSNGFVATWETWEVFTWRRARFATWGTRSCGWGAPD